jgi:hypothetical protein
MYPLIIIIRFVGGLRCLILVSKSYLNYPIYITFILLFFALIFWNYHFYIISGGRTINFIKILKSDKLEVRNYSGGYL